MASGGVMGGGWRPVIPVPSPNNTERTPEFTLELGDQSPRGVTWVRPGTNNGHISV